MQRPEICTSVNQCSTWANCPNHRTQWNKSPHSERKFSERATVVACAGLRHKLHSSPDVRYITSGGFCWMCLLLLLLLFSGYSIILFGTSNGTHKKQTHSLKEWWRGNKLVSKVGMCRKIDERFKRCDHLFFLIFNVVLTCRNATQHNTTQSFTDTIPTSTTMLKAKGKRQQTPTHPNRHAWLHSQYFLVSWISCYSSWPSIATIIKLETSTLSSMNRHKRNNSST